MRSAVFIALLCGLAVADASEKPCSVIGTVVRVIDGDTLCILVDSNEIKVRLEGIDAPESKQACGTQSKKALSDSVFGKDVRVDVTGKDRYGRTLGHVWIDETHINFQLIRDGWAWHYKHFSKDTDLADAEAEARQNRVGLWSEENPVPPWEFRSQRRKTEVRPSTVSDQNSINAQNIEPGN